VRNSALRSRSAALAGGGGGDRADDIHAAVRALVESCASVVGAASDCIGAATDARRESIATFDGAALARAATAFAELAAIALVRSNALLALERERVALGQGACELTPGRGEDGALAPRADRLRAVAPFRPAVSPAAAATPVEGLTRRERDVLRLLVRGNTNRQIAAVLGLSTRTVESHRANLMAKLGLASRVELVSYAETRRLL
jgi:DNA-binding CsgD family transcriptional regulator